MKIFKQALIIFLFFVNISFSQPAKISQAVFLFSFLADSAPTVQLKEAHGLAIDLNGFLYVADTENNRILKFNQNGEKMQEIGGFGWEKEQFYTPYDVCASSALDIFIADYNNHRLQRYDKDLNYISSLYSDDSWDKTFQFAYPKSMTISIHGDLFLLDGENIRVLKLNSFGEPEVSFGDYAEGKGRLVDPVQITISPKDQIFISERQNDKIIVFDYFGNYLSEIGTGILKKPHGLFFSSSQLLFVADTGNQRIVIFRPDGEAAFAWSKIDEAQGEFCYPVDVVNFGARIFVLDDNRILVFELK